MAILLDIHARHSSPFGTSAVAPRWRRREYESVQAKRDLQLGAARRPRASQLFLYFLQPVPDGVFVDAQVLCRRDVAAVPKRGFKGLPKADIFRGTAAE